MRVLDCEHAALSNIRMGIENGLDFLAKKFHPGHADAVDAPPDEVQIGMAVEAYALLAEEKIAIPYWRPTARSEA